MLRYLRLAICSLAYFILIHCSAMVFAEPVEIRYRDMPAELVISQISDRTLQIVVAPIDESAGEARPAPPSSVTVPLDPQEKLRRRALESAEQITVGRLRVEVKADPLTVTVRRPSGETVQTLAFDAAGDTLSFRTDATVLGMGEGAQQFDRRGARYTMRDGWGAWERPTHGSWVAVPFLIGADCWALLVHHPLGEFDLRGAEAKFKPWLGQTDVPIVAYVTVWDEPADVLREYGRVVGYAPLPPKWALGYMQSHRTLAGPQEVLQVARTLREKKLPCDTLIYLGTGYCPAGWNTGHASVEFNPATFDKPKEMIDALHDLHFHVVLHQNAPPRRLTGDKVTHIDAQETEETRRPNRRSSDISSYWARHRKTFLLGVDGWWPDDGDELRRESRINRHRLYYEGPLLDRPNVRPWNLQRTGYAGVQRYGGWIWTGDIDSRWETLKTQVPIGQNHSLSLSPYWGTDIGGFYPTRELTGELYVRWFQFGTFCPSFRAHGRTWHLRLPWGWNTGQLGPDEHNRSVDLSELRNPHVEPICRKYMELRYRLLPYTYTLCREAHETGLPLIRAMWLHYPEDEQAVTRGDQYLWGRDILVAPVVERGATERHLYLPEGNWYDFWSNAKHAGKREHTRDIDLETMPLYVRAGTILPLDPVRQYTSQPTDEPMTVRIYSGADGTFRLYEDDGQSLDYQRGQFAWTKFDWNDDSRRLTIQPYGGDLQPQSRALTVELVPGGERKTVSYDGQRIQVGIE
jgi:alpha-glucosidase/alpha-D-xyloside xylohydrolase